MWSDNISLYHSVAHDSLKEKAPTFNKKTFKNNRIGLKQTEDGIKKVKYFQNCKFDKDFQIQSRGTTWFPDGTWYFAFPKFPNHFSSESFYGYNYQTVVNKIVDQGYSIEYMP